MPIVPGNIMKDSTHDECYPQYYAVQCRHSESCGLNLTFSVFGFKKVAAPLNSGKWPVLVLQFFVLNSVAVCHLVSDDILRSRNGYRVVSVGGKFNLMRKYVKIDVCEALNVQVEEHRLAAVQCAQVLDGVFLESNISHNVLPFSPSAGGLNCEYSYNYLFFSYKDTKII